ncbi:MAG: hypothetical protein V4501_08540 [Pseudomonadota bacterium]
MHRNQSIDFPADWVTLRLLINEMTPKVVPKLQVELVTAELEKLKGFTNAPENTYLQELFTKCSQENYQMNASAREYFTENGYLLRNDQLNQHIKNIVIRSIYCAPEGTLSLLSPLTFKPTAILKRPTTVATSVAGEEPPAIPRHLNQPH